MSTGRFGTLRKTSSGRYQARYRYRGKQYSAGTFPSRSQAWAKLSKIHTEIPEDRHLTPEERDQQRHIEQQQAEAERAKRISFGEYADRWVQLRTNSKGEPLKRRTKTEYQRLLTSGPLTTWRQTALPDITPHEVKTWYTKELESGKRTQLAGAYDLMKSILKTAVESDKLIKENPCKVRGGSKASSNIHVEPPTDDELETILTSLPQKYEVIATLAAAGGLRFGEITALTRDDVTELLTPIGEIDGIEVNVCKAVVEDKGKRLLDTTKTAGSNRKVIIYGKDALTVYGYVKEFSPGELLWTDSTGSYLGQSALQYHWRKTRAKANRPDLHFHALRHYAGTRYAQAGATTKELLDRLGHSNISTAMRYQHATRQDEIARRAAR